MKRKNIATAVILILSVIFNNVQGQENPDKIQKHIKVSSKYLKRTNRKVIVNFDIYLDKFEITSNNQLTLTPILKTNSGGTHEFPAVVVNGKKRDNLYKRSVKLSDADNLEKVYSIIRAPQKEVSLKIPYKISIPYESWMKDAYLILFEELCGCGGSGKGFSKTNVADHIEISLSEDFEYDGFNPVVRFTDPPKESPKKRHENGQAYLIYRSGKWDIVPELFDNRKELKKIEQSLSFVKEEPTAVITSLSIKAYASPEGPFEDNFTLSEKRAESLRLYVQNIHRISSEMLTSKGYGEDWDGLTKQIESDAKVPNKEEVLKIIRTVGIFEGREKQLMDIAGGRSYNYMLEKFFPLLRRSDYSIEYTVPEFSIEKGKEIVKTKPQMLSLKEIYVIANTYEKGSEPFIELFKTALEVFPDDKYANLNAAAALIMDGNYDKAATLLEKYKNVPEAWNNLGIVYAYQYRFDEAEKYLQKALKQGDSEAKHNLVAVEDMESAYESFKQGKE